MGGLDSESRASAGSGITALLGRITAGLRSARSEFQLKLAPRSYAALILLALHWGLQNCAFALRWSEEIAQWLRRKFLPVGRVA
jgi:hypothetical protein